MPSTIISAASAASSRPMTFKLSTDPMFVRKVRDIVSRNRGVSFNCRFQVQSSLSRWLVAAPVRELETQPFT